MKQKTVYTALLNLTLVSAAALLAACGSDSSTPAADASISGTIVAAPVNGADVSVVDGAGNEVAAAVEKTDANGKYLLVIPNGSLGQDLIVKSTGGTFTDEATGDQGIAAGDMLAYASANSISNGGSVSATPGSTIIAKLVMDHGKTITEAQSAFDSAFGYTPDLTVEPADATAPAADATDESKLAGLRAAAFSQLTMDLDLMVVEQFDLLSALAEDLADGELDGENTGSTVMINATAAMPIDVQNRFVTALVNFHYDGLMGEKPTNDKTGLDNSQIGMLPFAKVALTGLTAGAYKVVYEPGEMDAMQGKTDFKLKITDDSGNPVSAASIVELDLMMHMSDRKHSTPDLDCEESIATAGDYDCTVYYVMPSMMATGDSMGFWQIKVTADSKTAVFYPKVMMAMGDTTRVLLKGIDPSDTISMMGVTSSRPYNLFRNRLNANSTSGHDFELFIAPMETMTSFPALEIGSTLNGTFNVDDVKVEFSTDETNWVEATGVGAGTSAGTWFIDGLTGLTDDVEGKIYVKLYVDSDASGTFEPAELKTTNGLDADGTNEYSFFKVTP